MMRDTDHQVTVRELRQFGCGLGILLLVIGSVLLWRGNLLGALVLCAALAVAHVFWWQWRGTRRVYSHWMAAARCLSRVMTRVILFVLYFVVLTPLALLARLCGKRFIDMHGDKGRDSYWVVRGPEAKRHDSRKQY